MKFVRLLVFYTLFLIPVYMFAANPDVNLHVAVTGSDANDGTPAAPLRTIQRAADLAQPGDISHRARRRLSRTY